ncbi:MAG: ABC transporter ATP-binding protein [Bdellovibrionota bacterium]
MSPTTTGKSTEGTRVIEVELRAISKSFGAVRANTDIHLRVESGTVHAIVGENGAGKSTAMKMLYGMIAPDSGEILIRGEKREWRSPKDAIGAGIGMVHQHFMLGGPYTALENIVLGAEGVRALAPLRYPAARTKLEALSKKYGLTVSLDQPVEDLPVGVQQRIEILKLLYRDARVLIFDEPTAVLTPQETQELFAQLRALCKEGKTVLIITHKLKEVMAIADRVTVFRGGSVAGNREIGATSPEDLASLMVGRKVSLSVEAPGGPSATGISALTLSQVTLAREGHERGSLHELSLEVRTGEVVGIAGVEGNGQSELLQLLLHPREFRESMRGEIHYFGKNACELTARAVREAGVSLIPEDRHHEGLLLNRPMRESFLLGLHRREPFCRFGFLQNAAWNKAGARAIEEFDIRPRMLEIDARGYSGGNQQKVIIAREFWPRPKLLIAAQPTRGVDVGAIEFIHQKILEARTGGAGVLLVSSELDEILALSDRILVLYEGSIAASFKRGEADEKTLGLKMGGAR